MKILFLDNGIEESFSSIEQQILSFFEGTNHVLKFTHFPVSIIPPFVNAEVNTRQGDVPNVRAIRKVADPIFLKEYAKRIAGSYDLVIYAFERSYWEKNGSKELLGICFSQHRVACVTGRDKKVNWGGEKLQEVAKVTIHEIGHYLATFYGSEDRMHLSETQDKVREYFTDYLKKYATLHSLYLSLVPLLGKYIGVLKQETMKNEVIENVWDSEALIGALIKVESDGNDKAIGDHHLAQKAYGALQIRKPYVDDVNRVFKTNYRAEDMLGNRAPIKSPR